MYQKCINDKNVGKFNKIIDLTHPKCAKPPRSPAMRVALGALLLFFV